MAPPWLDVLDETIHACAARGRRDVGQPGGVQRAVRVELEGGTGVRVRQQVQHEVVQGQR